MVSGSQPAPIFELFDTTLAATMPDVMGLWTTHSSTADAAVAFTVNAKTDVDAPLWRANFPSDLHHARFHLTRSEGALFQSQNALSTAIDRVHLFIHSRCFESDVAFDLSPTGATLAPPEQALLESLRALKTPDGTTSYGIGDTFAVYSRQALEQFQAFVERLLHVVAHYAWVETQINGRTLARTVVGWSGNVDSIWQTGLNATQVSLHQRTMALALASRDALLQTFSLTMQTALKLSVLVSLPGGLILMLPVAWQFIDRIMTQSKAGLTHEHV
ncbi:MAG: hypothetical protein ACAF41_27010 [Leptolyngbya sp. BL-A-14]